MISLFLKIVNMSITASFLVLAIILLRFILKKAPKWIVCGLWILVAIRLLCPVSVQSVFSLVPNSDIMPTVLHKGKEEQNIEFLVGVSLVWVAGMVVMGIYTLISTLRIKHQVREALWVRDRIWVCDNIASPFILGIMKPKIYLPSGMKEEDMKYVLAHEQAHLTRWDHIWKPLGFLFLSIYWFNPVLWIGYVLLCRDIEIACDERVLDELGVEAKKSYSTALINCSVPRKRIAACPVAFGEIGVKQRVRRALDYSEPTSVLMLGAILISLAATLCLLTNPVLAKDAADASLEQFLYQQILEHHKTESTEENYGVAEYEILGIKKTPLEMTIYLDVFYQEYNFEYKELKQGAGCAGPQVITVSETEDGYQLLDYWVPRDGEAYGKDIMKKFPMSLWVDAFDTDRSHMVEAAKQKARKHFGVENLPIDPMSDWGVLLELEFQSATEFDMVFTRIMDFVDVEGTVTTTSDYEIRRVYGDNTISYGEYRKEILGQDYTEPELVWENQRYFIESEEILRIPCDLKDTYGVLSPVEYVFCKPVTMTLDTGESYTKYYTVLLYVNENTLPEIQCISEEYH